MLILTRRKGESILIGNDIEVIFLGMGMHGEMRVGFKAPRDIPIVREEIADQYPNSDVLLEEEKPKRTRIFAKRRKRKVVHK